jgi:hypothetical protein
VQSTGPMRVGWARVDAKSGCQIGSDEYSWAFDGYNVRMTMFYVFFKSGNVMKF